MGLPAFNTGRSRMTPAQYETINVCKKSDSAVAKDIQRAITEYVGHNTKFSNASGDIACSYMAEPMYSTLKNIVGLTDDQITAKCAQENAYNNTVQAEYDKSGSTQNITDWYNSWKQTSVGQTATSQLQSSVESLWNKDTSGIDATTQAPTTTSSKILGMTPITFGVVSVISVGLLIFALVLTVKTMKAKQRN